MMMLMMMMMMTTTTMNCFFELVDHQNWATSYFELEFLPKVLCKHSTIGEHTAQ